MLCFKPGSTHFNDHQSTTSQHQAQAPIGYNGLPFNPQQAVFNSYTPFGFPGLPTQQQQQQQFPQQQPGNWLGANFGQLPPTSMPGAQGWLGNSQQQQQQQQQAMAAAAAAQMAPWQAIQNLASFNASLGGPGGPAFPLPMPPGAGPTGLPDMSLLQQMYGGGQGPANLNGASGQLFGVGGFPGQQQPQHQHPLANLGMHQQQHMQQQAQHQQSQQQQPQQQSFSHQLSHGDSPGSRHATPNGANGGAQHNVPSRPESSSAHHSGTPGPSRRATSVGDVGDDHDRPSSASGPRPRLSLDIPPPGSKGATGNVAAGGKNGQRNDNHHQPQYPNGNSSSSSLDVISNGHNTAADNQARYASELLPSPAEFLDNVPPYSAGPMSFSALTSVIGGGGNGGHNNDDDGKDGERGGVFTWPGSNRGASGSTSVVTGEGNATFTRSPESSTAVAYRPAPVLEEGDAPGLIRREDSSEGEDVGREGQDEVTNESQGATRGVKRGAGDSDGGTEQGDEARRMRRRS